jgi:polyhydroxybutyrate depolymerase
VSYAKSDKMRAEPRTVTVGSRARSVFAVEPATAPQKRLPVILVLHGDGGDALGMHADLPLERASGDGAYLLYLDYLSPSDGWDLETTENNRDVAFARAAVDDLAARASIDRERIYAAGYSRGGFFANLIACQSPGFLRAIASYAGGAPYNQREKWPNGFTKCPGQKATPLLAIHGTKDRGVTIDSGRFSATYWSYVAGCSASEVETTGYTECNAYRGCPAGSAVVFCEVPDGIHWPLKDVWTQAQLIDTTWTFFERVH